MLIIQTPGQSCVTLGAPLQAHLQSPYGLLAMRLSWQNQGLDTPVLWIDYSFLYLPSCSLN
jgi:PhoPQ-activated pathogenicity-related protein